MSTSDEEEAERVKANAEHAWLRIKQCKDTKNRLLVQLRQLHVEAERNHQFQVQCMQLMASSDTALAEAMKDQNEAL